MSQTHEEEERHGRRAPGCTSCTPHPCRDDRLCLLVPAKQASGTRRDRPPGILSARYSGQTQARGDNPRTKRDDASAPRRKSVTLACQSSDRVSSDHAYRSMQWRPWLREGRRARARCEHGPRNTTRRDKGWVEGTPSFRQISLMRAHRHQLRSNRLVYLLVSHVVCAFSPLTPGPGNVDASIPHSGPFGFG